MYNKLTMIVAWNFEEAGRYLETYKAYEFKPLDIIQHRVESDHLSKVTIKFLYVCCFLYKKL